MEEKTARLIDKYITELQEDFMDDSYIIENLLEIFTADDLRCLGFEHFIQDYMEDREA